MKHLITVDLGFGDSGKGTAVDYLVRQHNAKLVVKYCGGWQCAHNVVLPDGKHHTFSQFGAGTFTGAQTYLTSNFIVEPLALINEAKHLQELGVSDPLGLIQASPDCLVATPIHIWRNQLNEIARGGNPHGSCGKGIGETRKYWLDHGSDAIFFGDYTPLLLAKLELLRQRTLIEYDKLSSNELYRQIYNFNSKEYVDRFIQYQRDLDLRNNCLQSSDVIVYEGSQGVLLDEYFGFHPYTTWSTVTQKHALDFITTRDYSPEIEVIGVTRTYHTRHGAGPFTSECPNPSKNEHNLLNKWQGKFRTGHFDTNLFNYSMEVVNPDSLFVTHTDIQTMSVTNDALLDLIPSIHVGKMRTESLINATFYSLDINPLDYIKEKGNVKYTSNGPTYEHKNYW